MRTLPWAAPANKSSKMLLSPGCTEIVGGNHLQETFNANTKTCILSSSLSVSNSNSTFLPRWALHHSFLSGASGFLFFCVFVASFLECIQVQMECRSFRGWFAWHLKVPLWVADIPKRFLSVCFCWCATWGSYRCLLSERHAGLHGHHVVAGKVRKVIPKHPNHIVGAVSVRFTGLHALHR